MRRPTRPQTTGLKCTLRGPSGKSLRREPLGCSDGKDFSKCDSCHFLALVIFQFRKADFNAVPLRVAWIRIARLESRAILSVELQSSTSNGFGLTAAIRIERSRPEFTISPDCPESVNMQSSLTIHSFLLQSVCTWQPVARWSSLPWASSLWRSERRSHNECAGGLVYARVLFMRLPAHILLSSATF